MNDGKPSQYRDTDSRRPGASRKGSGPRRQRGFVERATSSGHSGRGSESVRPFLRDQLKLKALMPTPYPVPDAERPARDEHPQH